MGTNQPLSTYVTYLPAILQRPFMAEFLLAFEAVLSGGVAAPASGSASLPGQGGLEQIIHGISTYFDPGTTPAEFLPWLAQWAATSLRNDWSEATQRSFLSQIVPLYQKRGTAAGLEAVLALSMDDAVVQELSFPTSGQEMPPHFFEIIVTVANSDPVLLARKVREIRAIIDREKPAHTIYGLRVQYPAMRIHDDPNGDTAHRDFGPGILLGIWKDPVTGQMVKGTAVLGNTTSAI
jgi:phage tail-like protein